MTETPDFPPLTDADWPDEIADMLGGFAGGLNVYRTMAHNPALLRAWTDLREHVVNRTALGKQGSEVVILRTGVRLGSTYEWQQHVSRARKCGMDDARIRSLRGPVEGMAPGDALLAQADPLIAAFDDVLADWGVRTVAYADVAAEMADEGTSFFAEGEVGSFHPGVAAYPRIAAALADVAATCP